ncbi:methyltransferase domain-containing protein [Xinfangfangia sp. CPCC 101601]|uniref:Methyltransferase domain-containing protein n=1 Tax=Pseudogemmobacter lacusdianii TaxID=3069608 RepID=A0ABU0VZV6_9RHOB|nr:methyltransferase domain-containing protein [Xinfangfangia sp. CPCC 101601]MDQ2067281.1 methyltransferase domain-containing protein [Xinfangfangia sp. CPCC 101601]
MAVTDWNPAAYAAFRGLRLRPALDLLAQVPDLPPGDVVDLGCGDGAAAAALAMRFAGRQLIGVDASPAMLAKAQGYDARVEADIATWVPEAAPALIFTNAALQWLGDHAGLLPRLVGVLAKGGTLAVQMPVNYLAPSHQLLRDLAMAMFPDRFDFAGFTPPVAAPETYWDLLHPLGELSIWQTEYLQKLEPAAEGHPVRGFTASTAMRPFLEQMTASEAQAFTAAYDKALDGAYPLRKDGAALFPFRRMFIVLTKA